MLLLSMNTKQGTIYDIFEPQFHQQQATTVSIVGRGGQLTEPLFMFYFERSSPLYPSFPMSSYKCRRIPIEKAGSHFTKSFWQHYSAELLACRMPAWKLTSVSLLHQSIQVRPLLCHPLLFTRTVKLRAGLCAFVEMDENLHADITPS